MTIQGAVKTMDRIRIEAIKCQCYYYMQYFFSKINTPEIPNYATQLTTIPAGNSGNFKAYNRSSIFPLNCSSLPYFQLQFEASGKVTTPGFKFSDFGMLGLNNDVSVMSDCQYGGRTMYMVRYLTDDDGNNLNSLTITTCDNLTCVTHFDLTNCSSLQSCHLEQLAIVCPNIQGLNLQNCYHCLESLQGLQAVASHCHNLQGLNLLGIHFCIWSSYNFVSSAENHILLWETLSDMKLILLAVGGCFLKSEDGNKKKLICLYQKCLTIYKSNTM